MPKIKHKYDTTQVESRGDLELPRPAVYRVKVEDVLHRTQKTDGSPVNDLHVKTRVVEGPHAKFPFNIYVKLDEGFEWKLKELLVATGHPEKGGEIDTDLMINKEFKLRVTTGKNRDGEYQPNPGTMMPLDAASGASVADEVPPDEDPDTPDDPDLPTDEPAVPEATSNGTPSSQYESMSVDELTAIYKERELGLPKGRKTVEKLVEGLVVADQMAVPDDDYEDWTNEELHDELVNSRHVEYEGADDDRDALIDALRQDDNDENDPFAS